MSSQPNQTYDQLPVIDLTKCIDCDKCIEACPKGAISKQQNYDCLKCIRYCLSKDIRCKPEHYIIFYKKCDACGLCIEACSHNAIHWVNFAVEKCN